MGNCGSAQINPGEVVLKKLTNIRTEMMSKVDKEELLGFATWLSSKEHLKGSYLSPTFTPTKNVLGKIRKIQETSLKEFPVDKSEVIDVDEIEIQANNIVNKVKKNISIKLAVMEKGLIGSKRNIYNALSPVITTFPTNEDIFGQYRTGLFLGPWYLEWDESGLVIPKKCFSNAVAYQSELPMGMGRKKLNTDQTIDVVLDVIIEWNTKKAWNQQTCNSQTFCDTVFKQLKLKMLTSGNAYSEYISRIRKEGDVPAELKISTDLREACEISSKKITFKTHKELDDFVSKNAKKNPTFQEDFSQDYWLLQSWDRSFWMRKLKNDKDEKCAESKDGCPFSHPYFSVVG